MPCEVFSTCSVLRKWTRCHASSGGTVSANEGIGVPFRPVRNVRYRSLSLEPHLRCGLEVKSNGVMWNPQSSKSVGTDDPSPLPVCPWQLKQACAFQICCPFLREAASSAGSRTYWIGSPGRSSFRRGARGVRRTRWSRSLCEGQRGRQGRDEQDRLPAVHGIVSLECEIEPEQARVGDWRGAIAGVEPEPAELEVQRGLGTARQLEGVADDRPSRPHAPRRRNGEGGVAAPARVGQLVPFPHAPGRGD